MRKWIETTLTDICEDISYGYTASANTSPVGPKFLRITDIVPDRINWKTVPFCEADDKYREKYRLSIGDIVIARTGATTGYNKIIKSNSYDTVYASYLIRYRIDPQKAYPFYIGHVLQSNNWYDFVDAIAGGSAQPGANAKQLGSYELKLPPLPEQKAIDSVLSCLDDKIDLLHRQNNTLEAMAETLFRQWFVEEAEESWEDGVLSDFITVKYGKDHKKLANGVIPVFGSGGIMRYADTALYNKESVLIPRKGSLNNVLYINKPFWTVDTMFYTEMKRDNVAKYVYHFVKSLDLSGMNVGSAVPSMTTQVLNNMPLLIPSNNVLEKFEESLSPMYSKIEFNQNQISTLEIIRDILLSRIMKGEVEVKI